MEPSPVNSLHDLQSVHACVGTAQNQLNERAESARTRILGEEIGAPNYPFLSQNDQSFRFKSNILALIVEFSGRCVRTGQTPIVVQFSLEDGCQPRAWI